METKLEGWWFDPITSAIKDADGRTVGAALDPGHGVKMAAAEELTRVLRQVEGYAEDTDGLGPTVRLRMIQACVQVALNQLQLDQIASLPTTTDLNR